MQKKALIVVFCFSLMLSGCSTFQYVNRPRPWKYSNLTFELPAGWVKCRSFVDLLALTKDGQLLQQIRVFRYALNKEKVLPATKKIFTQDMEAQEIAELIINELSFNREHLNFTLLSNAPAVISSIDGFRIEYSFSTEDYLKYRNVIYGFKQKNHVYLVTYQAADQYYFDKDIAEFEKFIMSFKG